jgi:hypothetical protein
MPWTDLITSHTESTYGATLGLVKLVNDQELAWKPATGSNWMTVGQLLEHLTNAGGACVKGFVTGQWDMGDAGSEDPGTETGLPPAAKLPSVKSVADALRRIDADRRTALEMLRKAGEKDLATKRVGAPWNPTELLLGEQCLMMIDAHLATHKAQLFYYLKLMGKPVHTGHLYGM